MGDSLPLPNASVTKDRSPGRLLAALPRRWKSFLALSALTTLFITLLLTFSRSHGYELEIFDYIDPDDTAVPPRYSSFHAAERLLPQHNPDLPESQGIHGRYVFMNNHLWGVGWGNILQEMFLNAQLAYQANWTFVFYNYTWSQGRVGSYNKKPIPARVPLSALIAGPMAGGPFPHGDPTPRAVSVSYFRQVCEKRIVITTESLGTSMQDASAATIISAWVDKLNSIEDRCVEFKFGSDQLFNAYIFGDGARMLDVWPTLSRSPIITEFDWSPLIAAAVSENRALIHPALTPSDSQRTPLPGLLALHVRRGDYSFHCQHFANWSSQYNAFNSFPDFSDHFTPPPGAGWGVNTPENHEIYKARCYPEIDAIVERVMAVRAVTPGKPLDYIYVLTNGSREWLNELKGALRRAAAWTTITTSRDLHLTNQQKYVAQAVDMLIAQRADVFVGNGFSSLTSNVAMLRQAHGLPPEKMHFW